MEKFTMIDLRDVEAVEIELIDNVIWVNVNGQCALRIHGHKHLTIHGIPKRAVTK